MYPLSLFPVDIFTGQKQDGTGLLYYNARFYDPALGTFLSPDTLVPDAGRVVDYNRFLYVRGNPLKYSDPSGHLTEDEIRALLGNDFERLYHYWMTYDAYWIDVLATLEVGGTISASELAGQLQIIESTNGLQAMTRNGATSNHLWDWQGKGVYTVQNPGMAEQRDEIFDRNEYLNGIVSPVFDYSQRVSGRIRPFYLGAMMITQSIDPHLSTASYEFFSKLGLSDSWSFLASSSVQLTGAAYASEALVTAGVAAGVTASVLGGAAVLVVDMIPGSIMKTYESPSVYSVGWPGGAVVNPSIRLDFLARE